MSELRRPEDSPIERVTGRTRDSSNSDPRDGASRPAIGIVFDRLQDRPEGRSMLPRKEVIQPQVPLRLPCYDFTPITTQTLGRSFPKVRSRTSGSSSFRGVTGGVYKARERIHRGMLIRDY